MLMLMMFCDVICMSDRRTQVKFSIIITNQQNHFTHYSDTFLQIVSYVFRPLFCHHNEVHLMTFFTENGSG